MEYFNLLHLKKEPFSNSPDPELFYHSYQHKSCLQKLELAIRLKRGLSVVIGDIGTGKSTLSRQLVRILAKDSGHVKANLILDPEFTSPQEFLQCIIKTFSIATQETNSDWQLKEIIKNHLFKQGIELQMVPVLIIDEGQKLPDFCLEILREFLNYETNQHKLLQIVVFAQGEFSATLKKKANFADRITTMQHLRPLSYRETVEMIQFRLNQTREDSSTKITLFTPMALLAIYFLTGGYPRKIMMLCSKVILDLLVRNQKKAGVRIVLSAAKETPFSYFKPSGKLLLIILLPLLILAFIIIKEFTDKNDDLANQQIQNGVILPHYMPLPPDNSLPYNNQIEVSQVTPPPRMTRTTQTKEPQIFVEKSAVPKILGQLIVEEGVSLGHMISSVYGKYTFKREQAVLAANPTITDANRINLGIKITFPLLSNSNIMANRYIITLAHSATLQEGYNFIRNSGELSHELRVLPQFTKEELSSFLIILKKTYRSHKMAENDLQKLPKKFTTEIREVPFGH